MNRQWLKPFAIGAAVTSAVSVGAAIYKASTEPAKTLVLFYVKSEGLRRPTLPPDPAPQYLMASQYVLAIAQKCGVGTWTLDSPMDLDGPSTAELQIPLADVSNEIFNCLAKYVQPRRVILKVENAQTH